jgi:hypothetical protein
LQVSTFQIICCHTNAKSISRAKAEANEDAHLPNFTYSVKTANNNLRKHIEKWHAEEFRQVAAQKQWKFQLPHDKKSAPPTKNAGGREQFSPEQFMAKLVNFIVADDQVCRPLNCKYSYLPS